jgi:DNA-binding MarR family transcriptional regulator
MDQNRPGFELPLLLLGAFRGVVDSLHEELVRRGHPQSRPAHGFALQAIGADGAKVSEIGRRLGVSSQAAAKTVSGLEALGYVERRPHPDDARAISIRRTERGEELLELSATIFDRIRSDWAAELGAKRVAELERDLERMAGRTSWGNLEDVPGWLR